MTSLKKSSRPSYNQVDAEDREAQISSRTDILSKSFATDLWMKVITRSIDDVVLYKFMRQCGRELKEEEIEYEASALGFLFDKNYRIPMDDYFVDIHCPKCNYIWQEHMSIAAGANATCPECEQKTNWKYTTYTITENQTIREISLEELISLWGIEDIKGFRDGCHRRIEELVEKKIKTEGISQPVSISEQAEEQPEATTLSERIERLEFIVEKLVEQANS